MHFMTVQEVEHTGRFQALLYWLPCDCYEFGKGAQEPQLEQSITEQLVKKREASQRHSLTEKARAAAENHVSELLKSVSTAQSRYRKTQDVSSRANAALTFRKQQLRARERKQKNSYKAIIQLQHQQSSVQEELSIVGQQIAKFLYERCVQMLVKVNRTLYLSLSDL
jgi:hypothetical protein